MKKILIPVDFSLSSKNAAAYAVELADVFDAEIVLLNVVNPPVVIDQDSLPSIVHSQSVLHEHNREIFEQELNSLSKSRSTEIKGFVKEGFPSDVILQVARENDIDLIIMGMKGKGRSNSLFGSTTTAVIRRSSIPVFVIPETAVFKPIRSIAFATDFVFQTEDHRFTLLIDLANKFDATIDILNVQRAETVLTDHEFSAKIRTHLAFGNTKNKFHSIKHNNIVEGITDFIESNESDILAMMAQRRSFFTRVFRRTFTKEMSYATRIPLLVLQNK